MISTFVFAYFGANDTDIIKVYSVFIVVLSLWIIINFYNSSPKTFLKIWGYLFTLSFAYFFTLSFAYFKHEGECLMGYLESVRVLFIVFILVTLLLGGAIIAVKVINRWREKKEEKAWFSEIRDKLPRSRLKEAGISTSFKGKLFYEQETVLDTMQRDFNAFNIIGIQGGWGTGKTFVVAKFKEHLEQNERDKECEFVFVDLLACRLDAIDALLIGKVETILRKRGMLPFVSKELDIMLGNNRIWNSAKYFFLERSNFSSITLREIGDELKSADITAVIVFEDVDRIDNRDMLNKIFGIAEAMAGDHIKIIFQYNQEYLRRHEFPEKYLEKYIPHVINVRHPRFYETLIHLVENGIGLKYKNEFALGVDKFKFLGGSLSIPVLNKSIELNIKTNIRKIESFLMEIDTCVRVVESANFHETIRTIISTLMLKHFSENVYSKLFEVEDKKLTDVLQFYFCNCDKQDENCICPKYSLAELLSNVRLRQTLPTYKNEVQLEILGMFDFDLTPDKRKHPDIGKRLVNEKKNELIMRIVQSSTTEHRIFKYYQNLDNHGTDSIISLEESANARMSDVFRAFSIFTDDVGDWENLTIAYCNSKLGQKDELLIDELIEIFVRCCPEGIFDQSFENVYAAILTWHNAINLSSAISNWQMYSYFLEIYANGMCSFGDIDGEWWHRFNMDFTEDDHIDTLRNMLECLTDNKRHYDAKTFINKHIEVLEKAKENPQ